MMTDQQIIRRFKRNVIRLFLLGLKSHLEKGMNEGFDPLLSQQLGCVDFLLQTLKAGGSHE